MADDGESRDFEASEMRTYKRYVLATGSPLGMGRSGYVRVCVCVCERERVSE